MFLISEDFNALITPTVGNIEEQLDIEKFTRFLEKHLNC